MYLHGNDVLKYDRIYYAPLKPFQPNQNMCVRLALEMDVFRVLSQSRQSSLSVPEIMTKQGLHSFEGRMYGGHKVPDDSRRDLVGKALPVLSEHDFSRRSKIRPSPNSSGPGRRRLRRRSRGELIRFESDDASFDRTSQRSDVQT